MKDNTINNLFYDGVLYVTNKFGWKDPFKARKLRRLLKDVKQDDQHLVRTIVTTNLTALENNSIKNTGYPTLGSPGDQSTELMGIIIRDIILQLQTRYLIPVQPLDGPVGLVFQLRYTTNDPGESEELNQRHVSLEVIKRTVEARTRDLQTHWDVESQQSHNKDFKDAIHKAIVDEIVSEITAEHLNIVTQLAEQNNIKTCQVDNIVDQSLIGVKITEQCNQIAKDTRRGSGNWIIIPENKTLLHYMFPNQSVIHNNEYASLSFVGTWHNLDVYVGNSQVLNQQTILIGYKGRTTEIDGGIIYSPYVLLLPGGISVAESTFQPYIKLLTRYGLTYDDESPMFYRKIELI